MRGLQAKDIRLSSGHEPSQLGEVVSSLGDAVDDLSAELSSLKKLRVGSGDEAIFLATDTDDGFYSAKINALIAEHRHGVCTAAERVPSLVLDNVQTFKKHGLPSLFGKLDQFTDRAVEQGRASLLNISGGIKPVLPYIAIYGLLRRIPLTYTFEMTRSLVTLPPLPINFDWTSLQTAAQALQRIDQDTCIEQRALEGLLGEDFTRLEGLFEDAGEGQVTLSTFGFMLLKELESAREKPVMLSPSASGELRQMQGVPKQQLESLLDRVRNPLWRAQKYHTFRGTDLTVYKPGDMPHRLAGWLESGMVYVAALYSEHDEYERDLLNRRRDQYRSGDFTPYWPELTPESLTGEEGTPEDKQLDKVVEEWKKERKKLEARISEVRKDGDRRLSESKRKHAQAKQQLDNVKQDRDGLRKQLDRVQRERDALKEQLNDVQQEIELIRHEVDGPSDYSDESDDDAEETTS